MMTNINNKGYINSGLRPDIMRKMMENKNLLTKKGSIYVGTGTLGVTEALTPTENDNNKFLGYSKEKGLYYHTLITSPKDLENQSIQGSDIMLKTIDSDRLQTGIIHDNDFGKQVIPVSCLSEKLITYDKISDIKLKKILGEDVYVWSGHVWGEDPQPIPMEILKDENGEWGQTVVTLQVETKEGDTEESLCYNNFVFLIDRKEKDKKTISVPFIPFDVTYIDDEQPPILYYHDHYFIQFVFGLIKKEEKKYGYSVRIFRDEETLCPNEEGKYGEHDIRPFVFNFVEQKYGGDNPFLSVDVKISRLSK